MVRPNGNKTHPVFIAGRQHSGNTVMALLLERIPGWYVQSGENSLLELHGLIDRIEDPSEKADELFKRLSLEDPDNQKWMAELVTSLVMANPDRPCIEIYKEAMDRLVVHRGDHSWGQKGTSYIFHADELLRLIPNSKLIYLMRNPWDLTASLKRRKPESERAFGQTLSWTKGVRIAQRLTLSHPERFKLIRYEDLTGKSRETVRDLCQWLGEPYDDSLLEVPRVNTSENKIHTRGLRGREEIKQKLDQADTSTMGSDTPKSGLTNAKVFKYQEQLPPYEIARIDQLLWAFGGSRLIETLYPDIPHQPGAHSISAKARSLLGLPLTPIKFTSNYLTAIKRSPMHFLARTIRRLRA